MRAPYWDFLGIEPTPDEGIVRRAYAAKLRVTNPEDDADGFKQLREAYEHAMGHARYLQANPPEADVAETDAQDDAEAGPRTIVIPPAPPAPGVAHTPVETATRDPLEIERRDHDALCQRLMSALQDNGEVNARVEAFNAVIKSPAMQQLDVFTATEGWMIHTLISMRPKSDPLFDPAIAYFKWEDQRVGDRNGGAQHILYLRQRVDQERDAQRLLARIKDRKHEFHRAWKETTRPPSERSWLNKTLSRRHQTRVTEFLEYLSRRSPLAIESLNPEAVSWWWGSRPKPRTASPRREWLTRVAIMIAIVGGLLTIANTMRENREARRPPYTRLMANDDAESLDVLKMVDEAADASRRRTSRSNCADIVLRLRDLPERTRASTLNSAEKMCNRALLLMPDSLMVRQYAGIAALRAGKAQLAIDHFDKILAASPDDPYALYGRGLVALIPAAGARLGDQKDVADALTMQPDVEPYFAQFGLSVPANIRPSKEAPPSRLPERARFGVSTQPQELPDPPKFSMQELGTYFGFSKSVAGVVLLDCLIDALGNVGNCVVASEKPANLGIGEVGLRAMQSLHYKPAMLDGEPVGGARLSYTLTLGDPPAPPRP